MNKNENKYFSTAQKMDEALITLLEKKDLLYITVKDICQTAQVNRSTFYLHYETIQDLLSETLEYLDRQFYSYFTFAESAADIIGGISEMPLDRLVFIREKYLVPYLRYIQENKIVFAAAYRQKQVLHTEERMQNLYRYIIEPILCRFQVPTELRMYYHAFFLHGTLAIIQEWLKNGCTETPEDICKIIESLVIREKQDPG